MVPPKVVRREETSRVLNVIRKTTQLPARASHGLQGALAHEPLAGTRERAHFLHGNGWHEAGADQAGVGRSASHVASLTSVLRPGTFFTCAALAKISSKWPSSTCHTGFQYTPVASMATCATPKESSQSARLSRPEVVVAKVRTSCN